MNLTKRLQEAADRRSSETAAPTSVTTGRNRPTIIDLGPADAGLGPAIDLRTGQPQEQPAERTPKHDGGSRWFGAVTRLASRRDRRNAVVENEQQMRSRHLYDVPPASRACPRCGAPSRLDINDLTRGVLHLSCDSCFKMWQVSR